MTILLILFFSVVIMFFLGAVAGNITASYKQNIQNTKRIRRKEDWWLILILGGVCFLCGLIIAYLLIVIFQPPKLTGGSGINGSAAIIDFFVVLTSLFGNIIIALFLRGYIKKDSREKLYQERMVTDRLIILEGVRELENKIFDLSPPNYRTISIEIINSISNIRNSFIKRVSINRQQKQKILNKLEELEEMINNFSSEYQVISSDKLLEITDLIIEDIYGDQFTL